MKYCSHCGKELVDEAIVCPGCGCGVAGGTKAKVAANPAADVPNTGLNIISFLLPVIGVILYILEHERAPKKAAAIGQAAAIGFGVSILFFIPYFDEFMYWF